MNKWMAVILMLASAPVFAADPSAADAKAKAHVESLARDFYKHFAALDSDAIRQMSTPELEILSVSTPEFEIYGEGLHIGHTQLAQQLAKAKQADRKLTFQLTQFRTVVTRDVAYTSYMLHIMPDDKVGIGEVVLRKQGERWLLDRLVHMPFYPGYPQ